MAIGFAQPLVVQSSNSIGMASSTAGGSTAGVAGSALGAGVQYLLYAGSNITLSQSVVGASGSLSIYAGNTLSSYEPYPMHNTGTAVVGLNTNTSGAMSLWPFTVCENVAAENVAVLMSMSFITGGTSSFNQSGTLQWGLYTRPTGESSSLLNLAGSSSFGYSVSFNNSSISFNHPTTTNASGIYSTGGTNSAGSNISSGYTGLKMMLLGLNSTITPGNYWLGIHNRMSSSSFNSGLRMSIYGNSQSLVNLAPMGSFSTAYTAGSNVPLQIGGNWQLGAGSYSAAALTALASPVALSNITQNVGHVPYMNFMSRT